MKGDEVWFSEVSPRPHDTGLVTLATQYQSEFAIHARAILGLPVDVALREPGASAVIYGGLEAKGIAFEGVAEALAVPGADLRLFGKPESFAAPPHGRGPGPRRGRRRGPRARHRGGRQGPARPIKGLGRGLLSPATALLLLGQQIAESVQLAFQGVAALGDPAFEDGKAGGLDTAGAHPAGLPGAHQAAVLQHLQVLRDRSDRHAQRLRQAGHRARPFAQALDYGAPRRIAESMESPVHLVCGAPTFMRCEPPRRPLPPDGRAASAMPRSRISHPPEFSKNTPWWVQVSRVPGAGG